MAQSLAAFGLYPSSKALYVGAEALRAAKFRHTDISVMYSDGQRAIRLRESEPLDDSVADADEHDGSLAGFLTSLSGLGAVVMPHDGPFMAGGPILSTLAGSGTLLSSLRGLGLPECDIDSFEERLRQGGLLLSVQCEDEKWAARARSILEQTGAERVAATT